MISLLPITDPGNLEMIHQLSRIGRSCGRFGEIVIERPDYPLPSHHIHLRLMQLLSGPKVGGIGLLCLLHVGVV